MPSSQQTRRVLILESDASIARAFCTALEAAGFGTACASSQADGARLVVESTPDLVICTCESKNAGDTQEAEALRAQIKGSEIPCILLAPHLDTELLRETIEFRTAELLLTPLDPAQLVASVEARLRFRNPPDTAANTLSVPPSVDSWDDDHV